ncbi:MAG: SUMF1/EgtB/PvdO family nonheme iron enzyme [Deltaproteobacteria bacterium]|nr:SUMF1/EgtB/PvdO family nonheme iron enzyme [Deltaproteobacteria bacterium]
MAFLTGWEPAFAALGLGVNLLGRRDGLRDTVALAAAVRRLAGRFFSVPALAAMLIGALLMLPFTASREQPLPRGTALTSSSADSAHPDEVTLRLGDGHVIRMDRFEADDGGVTYADAQAQCRERGKRLCTEREWVAACRGAGQSIYLYGDDPAASRSELYGRGCNVRPFFDRAPRPRRGRRANAKRRPASPT